MIESEQSFIGKLGNELDCEKWISSRFFMDQFCEGTRFVRLTMKGIRNKLLQVFSSQRCKHDVLPHHSCPTHRFELAHQRMSRVYFVVPVSADQQQVLRVGLREQILQQV